MKRIAALTILLTTLCLFRVSYGQETTLCVGNYWTEPEAKVMMDSFALQWSDKSSWEKRAQQIRSGIIEGMKLPMMPKISGHFNPIVTHHREMDGYSVENIAIESFPGFYITGNLYRPAKKQAEICCYSKSAWTWSGQTLFGRNTEALCSFSKNGSYCFYL